GPRRVTIGTVTYTFVASAPAASTATAVQVVWVGTHAALTNEVDTALNLVAAINATSASCNSTPPCFGSGTVANAIAKASNTGSSNIDTITATTNGAAGDFTISESGGGIAASGGAN